MLDYVRVINFLLFIIIIIHLLIYFHVVESITSLYFVSGERRAGDSFGSAMMTSRSMDLSTLSTSRSTPPPPSRRHRHHEYVSQLGR